MYHGNTTVLTYGISVNKYPSGSQPGYSEIAWVAMQAPTKVFAMYDICVLFRKCREIRKYKYIFIFFQT